MNKSAIDSAQFSAMELSPFTFLQYERLQAVVGVPLEESARCLLTLVNETGVIWGASA